MPVSEYVSPEKFDLWQREAEALGFLYVASGALVRSSYRAGEFFIDNILEKRGEGKKHDASLDLGLNVNGGGGKLEGEKAESLNL